MTHALRRFIDEQMDLRSLSQADVARASGMTRAHVSKLVNDDRDRLPRLPEAQTIRGLARAFRMSTDVVLGKALEALGLGFSSADFTYEVATATDDELLSEVERRVARYRALATSSHVGLIERFLSDPSMTAEEYAAAAEELRAEGTKVAVVPTLAEARNLARQRLLDAAQPAQEAAYEARTGSEENT